MYNVKETPNRSQSSQIVVIMKKVQHRILIAHFFVRYLGVAIIFERRSSIFFIGSNDSAQPNAWLITRAIKEKSIKTRSMQLIAFLLHTIFIYKEFREISRKTL